MARLEEETRTELREHKPSFFERIERATKKGVEKAENVAQTFVEESMPLYFKHGQEAMKFFAIRPDVALGVNDDVSEEELELATDSWANVIRGSHPDLYTPEHTKKVGVYQQALRELATDASGKVLDIGTRPSSWVAALTFEKVVAPAAVEAFKFLPKGAQEGLKKFFKQDALGWMKKSGNEAYRELGVPTNMPFANIQKTYRALAMQTHPDRLAARLGRQPTQAEIIANARKFGNVTSAYEKIKSITTLERQALKAQATPKLRKAQAIVPKFNEGDVVKIGKDVGRVVSVEGTKAVVNINNKNIIKNINKLKDAPDYDRAINLQSVDLNFPTPVFDAYKDYVRGLKLPESSDIVKFKNEIASVRGKRLAGTLSIKESNKQVKELNKKMFETAKKEGIATEKLKSGKLKLSLRDSGIYVPESFNKYPKFKNVGYTFGGGMDITRAIQNIDGALTVRDKLALPGGAGAAEQGVLWKTRDIMKSKVRWVEEARINAKNAMGRMRTGSKADKATTELLKLINKDLATTPPLELFKNKGILGVLKKFPVSNRLDILEGAQNQRLLYEDMRDSQNAVRAQLNRKLIPYQQEYTPDLIRDVAIWNKASDFRKEINEVMDSKAPVPDYIIPNAPVNPRAMAKRNGIPYAEKEMSSIKLMEDYISAASKDMFNTTIIQNNKAYAGKLKEMGYEKSADLINRWTAESFAGISPALDRALTLPPWATTTAKKFNRARNLGVFAFNFGWSVVTQPQSFARTIARYGTYNSLSSLVQWLGDSNLRANTANQYYSYIIKQQKTGRVSSQDVGNYIGGKVTLNKNVPMVLEDTGYLLINEIEKILTGTSIQAAKKYGTKRGLTGQALDEFASDGGAKTQEMYNAEDRPLVLNSLAVKTGAPFQTFAFGWLNTIKEFSGKTGTPPDHLGSKLMTFVRWAAATAVLQAYAKSISNRKFYFFDPSTMPVPFGEYWFAPGVRIMSGVKPIKEGLKGIGINLEGTENNYYAANSLPSPVQTGIEVANGLKDAAETGSWRRMRNVMLKNGTGLFGIAGGGQLARVVDAILGYSTGGIPDRNGKIKYGINGVWDATKYTLFGSRALSQKTKGNTVDQSIGDLDIDFGDIEFDMGEIQY